MNKNFIYFIYFLMFALTIFSATADVTKSEYCTLLGLTDIDDCDRFWNWETNKIQTINHTNNITNNITKIINFTNNITKINNFSTIQNLTKYQIINNSGIILSEIKEYIDFEIEKTQNQEILEIYKLIYSLDLNQSSKEESKSETECDLFCMMDKKMKEDLKILEYKNKYCPYYPDLSICQDSSKSSSSNESNNDLTVLISKINDLSSEINKQPQNINSTDSDSNYFLIIVCIVIVIAGYFYFSKQKQKQDFEKLPTNYKSKEEENKILMRKIKELEQQNSENKPKKITSYNNGL
jgi:hypothetical protein